tara:strand:+ start:1677 stop:2183 length:507 start_codon:yes stop_codon:yes gene_type:complete
MFYDMYKNDEELKYICKHLGGLETNPALVMSWIFIIIVISYIMLYNKKLPNNFVMIAFVILIFLIFFANIDYMSRTNPTNPTIYSIPHYTFTVLTYLIFIYGLYFMYNKYIVLVVFLLFIVFCCIHLYAIQQQNKNDKKKYLRYSVALELVIIYGIIFLFLLHTINNV